MKIALVHKRLELRGGTERVLYRTVEGLRDRGHEVHLFCQQFRIPVPSGVRAHRVPGIARPRGARVLSFAYFAPRVVARHNCDVVMSFDRIFTQDIFRSGAGPRKLLLEKLKSESGILRKLWYATSLYHHLVVSIENRQIRKNNRSKIIAVCRQTKKEFIDVYGISEERVRVIHNGVDCVQFDPKRRCTEGRQLRAELKIPPDARVALFVGTGFRRKGLHRLLDLWDRNELPGVYLVVVGNDRRLASFRKRWRSEKRVIFAGPQDKVENYYACADVLVLPALQEAFGNVVLEAMASGLPVVTVAGVGALDHASAALCAGILSDPGDPSELKSKILQMLDEGRWPALAQEARQTAEKYTWDNYLDKVEQTLREGCRRF